MSLQFSRPILVFFGVIFSTTFFISPSAQAEYWLNDDLYIENNQRFILKNKISDTHWQLLPELTLVQDIMASKLTLSAKFDLQENNSTATINSLNLTTSLSSYWGLKVGRQKIDYAQNDMFLTSLSKSNNKFNALNYSQGLLITHSLGIIEQTLFLDKKTQQDDKQELNYLLKVGIPGYKIGPLKIILQKQADSPLRGIIGSALQFPLHTIHGDWQWAFQYGSELDQQKQPKKQQAWQTSFSWLGFIPQHTLGLLISHTDKQWTYSEDFTPDQDRIEMGYQWIIHQELNIELAISQINRTTEEITARLNFSF